MDAVGIVLIGLGGIAAVVGGLWVIVMAFQESVLWGLVCLLIGPAMIVFAIMHWEEAKTPFLISVAGSVVLVLGFVVGGSG